MKNKIVVTFFFSIFLYIKSSEHIFQPAIFFPTLEMNSDYLKKKEYPLEFFSINVSRAYANSAFNQNADKTGIFSAQGDINFLNFKNEKVSLTRSGTDIFNGTSTDTFKSSCPSSSPGNLQCNANSEVFQFDLNFKLYTSAKIFFEASLPLRAITIGNIKFENSFNKELEDYVNKNIDDLLQAHSIQPISQGFSARGFSDLTLGIGKSMKCEFEDELIVQKFAGSASIGFIIPTSMIHQTNQSYLFHVPLGYNEHFGNYGKANLSIDFLDNLNLNLSAEVKSFFKKHKIMRLKHNKDIDFLKILHIQETEEDLGSIWSLKGYLKSNIYDSGINFFLGYSYNSQEKTVLKLPQETIDKKIGVYDLTKINNIETLATASPTSNFPEKEDRIERSTFTQLTDDLINSDASLKSWYFHAIHLGVLIQPEISSSMLEKPSFKAFLNYPVYGKSCAAYKTYSGDIGIYFDFNF